MTYVSMPPQITKTKIATRPPSTMIEIWIERDALEIVASAAIRCAYNSPLVETEEKVLAAIEALQAAVRRNDFDAPLDTGRI